MSKTAEKKAPGWLAAQLKKAGRLLMLAAEDAKPLDVTEVQISDRSVGGKVELIGTDGTLSPIPDGTYVLSDDFKFTVAGGFITAIGDVEVVAAATEPTEEEKKTAEGVAAAAAPAPAAITPEEADEIRANLQQVNTRIDEVMNAITELKSALTATGTSATLAAQSYDKLTGEIVKLNEHLEKEPITPSRTNLKEEKENKKNEQAANLATALNAALNTGKEDKK